MRGIPLNLASQPVERTARARRIAALAGVVLLVASLLHGAAIWYLAAATGSTPGDAAAGAPAVDAARVARWRSQVEGLTEAGRVDRAQRVATAVALANELIDWKTFPWHRLFRDLEETLPDDVRLELVQPVSDAQGVQVELIAAGRDRVALRLLLEGLLERPGFQDVFPLSQTAGEDGLQRLTLQARYVPADEATSRSTADGSPAAGAPSRAPRDPTPSRRPSTGGAR